MNEMKDDHRVHTIPNHHPTKWMLTQKIWFKSSLLLNGVQIRPPTNIDDLCLFFCFYPSYHTCAYVAFSNNSNSTNAYLGATCQSIVLCSFFQYYRYRSAWSTQGSILYRCL